MSMMVAFSEPGSFCEETSMRFGKPTMLGFR